MVFSIVKYVSENSGQTPGSKTDDISSSKLPDQKHKDIHKGFISMRAYSLFSKQRNFFSSYKKFSFIKMFILWCVYEGLSFEQISCGLQHRRIKLAFNQ